MEVHDEADAEVIEHGNGGVDDHQERQVPNPMNVGEVQVGGDNVEKSDLDDAHDDQQFRDETGKWWNAGKRHHEHKHGHGQEGVSFGKAAER